jgi:hypothetical protein
MTSEQATKGNGNPSTVQRETIVDSIPHQIKGTDSRLVRLVPIVLGSGDYSPAREAARSLDRRARGPLSFRRSGAHRERTNGPGRPHPGVARMPSR